MCLFSPQSISSVKASFLFFCRSWIHTPPSLPFLSFPLLPSFALSLPSPISSFPPSLSFLLLSFPPIPLPPSLSALSFPFLSSISFPFHPFLSSFALSLPFLSSHYQSTYPSSLLFLLSPSLSYLLSTHFLSSSFPPFPNLSTSLPSSPSTLS